MDGKTMSPNWEMERAQFPAAQNQTYLLTAAAGPLSQAAWKAYQEHYSELLEHGDIHWLKTLEEIEETRREIVPFIDAHNESEIAFTSNTSLAMNLLAMTFKELLLRQKKPLSVLTCKEEFPSTTLAWIHHGFQVNQVSAVDLEKTLSLSPPSITLTSAVQYGTGFRQDLDILGDICHRSQSYLIVNATQSLGAFPVRTVHSGITALAASCHKWMCCGFGLSLMFLDEKLHQEARWPLAGWLGVRKPMNMDNFHVDLAQTARAFELGVPPIATIAALRSQMKELSRIGAESISQRILELSEYLVEEIQDKLPSVEILSKRARKGDTNTINSGIVLLRVPNAEKLLHYLAENNIHVSFRQGGLRIATHFFNNRSDIDRLLAFIDRFQALNPGV
jgi:selenocysteine lyase/cysteine desulfurase